MEDIEVLDLDEDVDIKKDDKEKIDRKSRKAERKQNNNIKNKKESDKSTKKRTLKRGEKIFLLCNLLIIFGIIGIYAYRTIHFYKLTHNVTKDITLKEKLTALTNIAYQNDGLYEKDGYFYFKGSNVDNYVYYSGNIYRIIDINNGIRMILDDTTTNLVWGMQDKYSESTIYNWLNDYYKTLKDSEVYLKENNWCNEKIDVSDYQCKDTISNYVGLLSTNDYLQAGGKNSYLNNETYYWTLNLDKDGKSLYINKEGSINNLSSNEENYFSYGIRPVITLKEDLTIISGDGTKDNPFIIEDLGKALLKDNSIGSFVKYNNDEFRILSVDDDGITLIYNGVLEIEKNFNDTMKYLNSEYLKKFEKEELVKINYNINEYNLSNKYNYLSDNKNSDYVVIPKIGDLFINDYDGYWLNNISDSKLELNYIIDENKMLFGDLKSNKHLIRPIIKLNNDMVVNLGNGTKNDPLMVGDNNAI